MTTRPRSSSSSRRSGRCRTTPRCTSSSPWSSSPRAAYEQAAAPLYAVLSVGPGWDWTTLISNYSDANLYTQQLRSLEAFVKANPRSAQAHFVLAYHYITQGHGDAAAGQLKQVVALQPSDTLSAQLLGKLQPASAAPETPAAPPQSQPVDAGKLTGDWTASAPQNSKVSLSIKEDGGFSLDRRRTGQASHLDLGNVQAGRRRAHPLRWPEFPGGSPGRSSRPAR